MATKQVLFSSVNLLNLGDISGTSQADDGRVGGRAQLNTADAMPPNLYTPLPLPTTMPVAPTQSQSLYEYASGSRAAPSAVNDAYVYHVVRADAARDGDADRSQYEYQVPNAYEIPIAGFAPREDGYLMIDDLPAQQPPLSNAVYEYEYDAAQPPHARPARAHVADASGPYEEPVAGAEQVYYHAGGADSLYYSMPHSSGADDAGASFGVSEHAEWPRHYSMAETPLDQTVHAGAARPSGPTWLPSEWGATTMLDNPAFVPSMPKGVRARSPHTHPA